MNRQLYQLLILILTFCAITVLNETVSFADRTVQGEVKREEAAKYKIPDSVLNIAKDNTYPNPSQDMPQLQPSELTKELLDTSKVKIENPDLILMLNETSITKPMVAIGHKATIYLGKWPLNYESKETALNWEYQKINTNHYDNRD